jgi:hypothetical protein
VWQQSKQQQALCAAHAVLAAKHATAIGIESPAVMNVSSTATAAALLQSPSGPDLHAGQGGSASGDGLHRATGQQQANEEHMLAQPQQRSLQQQAPQQQPEHDMLQQLSS